MEGLAVPFETITTGVSNVLSYLNPLDGNFLLKGVLDFLATILDYLNPFSENFILYKVINLISEIISYLNPFSENFFVYKLIELLQELLEYLFVPKEDHFGYLSDRFNEKFGFVSQIREIVDLIISPMETHTFPDSLNPTWDITYYGVTVPIIDWTAFDKYRSILHGIIIAVFWISYGFKLYRRIPGIIHGFTTN